MNDDAAILDQADEEALVYDVSDEVLEAAAGPHIPPSFGSLCIFCF